MEVELDGVEFTYSGTGAVGLGLTRLDGVVALRDSVVEFGAADHCDGLVVRMEGSDESTEQRLDVLIWEHSRVLQELSWKVFSLKSWIVLVCSNTCLVSTRCVTAS